MNKQIKYFNNKRPASRGTDFDGNKKILLEDFIVTDQKRGHVYRVPKGYISDGKSVPEALEWCIGDPFEGVTEPAAWVHDFECEFAKFCLDERSYQDKKDDYLNPEILLHEQERGRKIKSQKQTHRIFRELVYFEMQRNNEYGWIRYPWNLHNSKVWQYQRCKIMWIAVRGYNRVKNPKWK